MMMMSEISGLLELGGRKGRTDGRTEAFEIASISLLSLAHSPHGRGGRGSCLQRKLIEGIDKLAKNTAAAGKGGGGDRSNRRQQQCSRPRGGAPLTSLARVASIATCGSLQRTNEDLALVSQFPFF